MEIHHVALRTLFEIGGFPVSQATIWMLVAAFVSFIVIYGAGKKALVPGRYQGAMEIILMGIREKLVIDTMGPEGLPYFPLIASLFFFVFFCNIIGILPIWDFGYVPTSTPHVTATLTILVFTVVLLTAFKKKGIVGFLKSFAPPGVPLWLMPLIYPVEVISLFAKHFALAVRLYANMFAGHTVLIVFATASVFLLGKGFLTILAPLPLVGVVAMLLFEIFVATVQAFIFAILAALYIGDSLHEHH